METVLRRAVRAVVFDSSDRVLLVRFLFESGPLWATPGGGINDGETPEAAIRRELAEEVGLTDFQLGPHIWNRTHLFPLSANFDGQDETFFLVRTDSPLGTPSFSEEQLQAEGMGESRWWTLDELRNDRDICLRPTRLVELLDRLLADGPPVEPIDTGV